MSSLTIHEAAYKGDYDTVVQKLEEDPTLITKLDSNGRILLHWVAVGGSLKLAAFLIDQDSPIDARDDTQATPLILAASAGRSEVVDLLLRKGAQVNVQTEQGHSALQYACSKGWFEICKSLLEHGADVNIMDNRGATPLHRAASKGNLAIVRLLLDEESIKVNCRDSYGNTPLHLACEEERRDEALLLVQHGADLHVKNKEEKTPLDLCTNTLKKLLCAESDKTQTVKSCPVDNLRKLTG